MVKRRKRKLKKRVLLNYSSESVDLSSYENAIEANEVIIPYSGVVTTSYQYDKQRKIYLRSVNDRVHIDYVTKEQYGVKNIITYQVSNHTLTGDVKGRQDIDNIGMGNGYYITEGYAVPIKWEKNISHLKLFILMQMVLKLT